MFKYDIPSTFHFHACVGYRAIEHTYQKSFNYCKHNVHCLHYTPIYSKLKCDDFRFMLKRYIRPQDVVLYKGGTFEKSICDMLNIKYYNIELWGVPKVKNIAEYNHCSCCGQHFKKT